jgi:hypothetical protein
MKIIDVIKTIKNPLECLDSEKIPVHYVRYTDFYDEYNKMVHKGQKKCNAILTLSEKHLISEKTAHNIITLFEKEIGT